MRAVTDAVMLQAVPMGLLQLGLPGAPGGSRCRRLAVCQSGGLAHQAPALTGLGCSGVGPLLCEHVAPLASSMPALLASGLLCRAAGVHTALQAQLLLAGSRGLGWEGQTPQGADALIERSGQWRRLALCCCAGERYLSVLNLQLRALASEADMRVVPVQAPSRGARPRPAAGRCSTRAARQRAQQRKALPRWPRRMCG